MSATEARDPLVGRVLDGRFRVEELLDRGGMGKVYRAVQEPLGREVALKTLDIVDKAGIYQKRFFLEASALAKLSHPNTVRVLDYGSTEDGVYYFAMEYLRGANLHTVLHAEGGMSPARTIHILEQVAAALAEAHAAHIVHRDLKPANVYLTRHGDSVDHVKVIDFGLVKDITRDAGLSMSGEVLGTPSYMAPEQVDDGDFGPHTDVYSLGVILYECLTGKVPFTGKTSIATLMMHLQVEPPRIRDVAPHVHAPDTLIWLVDRCLEKEPSDRPRDMREVIRALRICARQLRGELPASVVLELQGGVLRVPKGIVEEVGAPLPVASASRPVPSGSRSVVRTAAVGLGLASGVLVVLAVLAGAAIVVGAAGAGMAWYAASTPASSQSVVVESEPAGAMVRIDGSVVGHTPFVVDVPDGSWLTIEIKQRGYKLESKTIYGTEGRLKFDLVKKQPKPEKAE